MHKLSSSKLFAINTWVQSGQYGLKAHPEQKIQNPCINEKETEKNYLASTDIKGYTKIGSKMPNFTNSFVLEILISGTPHLAILDCGATRSLITTAKYQEIFCGKVDFLKPPPNINFFGKLCKKYQSIFSLNKMDIGKCNESDQVSFSLRSNTIPVNVRPYPVNRKLHERAMKFIGKLLDLGLFRPAKQNEDS